MNDKTIAIIGAGQMGGGIAQVAAASGFKVLVFDSQAGALGRCEDNIRKRLARQVDKLKGLGQGGHGFGPGTPPAPPAPPEQIQKAQTDMDTALARLQYVHDLEMIRGAGIVVEAIVEDAGIKKQLFAKLAQMFTHNEILASNTSSISITELAAASGAAAGRVIGMHFFNPVPVMKLVEVIKGLQTAPDTTERVLLLAKQMGKTPIPANDRAGFVSNRVLMPMINEAFYAWMEGVAEPEHIDDIMKLGCNIPMGPLELADFIGLDTCVNIMNVLAEGLGAERYRPCPLLRQLVAAGRMGVKTQHGVYKYPREAKK
jgi:3-hydroxybutyryl-CoA dehydrogenase